MACISEILSWAAPNARSRDVGIDAPRQGMSTTSSRHLPRGFDLRPSGDVWRNVSCLTLLVFVCLTNERGGAVKYRVSRSWVRWPSNEREVLHILDTHQTTTISSATVGLGAIFCGCTIAILALAGIFGPHCGIEIFAWTLGACLIKMAVHRVTVRLLGAEAMVSLVTTDSRAVTLFKQVYSKMRIETEGPLFIFNERPANRFAELVLTQKSPAPDQ